MSNNNQLKSSVPWTSIKTLSRDATANMPEMTPERFESGKTFAEFVDQAVELKDLWQTTWKRTAVSDTAVDQLESLPGKWHLLALTEDWCLDAISTLSAVARLSEQVSNVNLRLLERDQNLDIMDAHLTNGGRSIPAIILYNESWMERAWWGPRPEELQNWYMTGGGKEQPSDERYKYIRTWYVRDKGESIIRDIIRMISDASSHLAK